MSHWPNSPRLRLSWIHRHTAMVSPSLRLFHVSGTLVEPQKSRILLPGCIFHHSQGLLPARVGHLPIRELSISLHFILGGQPANEDSGEHIYTRLQQFIQFHSIDWLLNKPRSVCHDRIQGVAPRTQLLTWHLYSLLVLAGTHIRLQKPVLLLGRCYWIWIFICEGPLFNWWEAPPCETSGFRTFLQGR